MLAAVADRIKGIEIHGLKKSFGSVEALRGVDLTVKRGEIVGMVGPNGAGKSTMMRTIATLILPDAGNVSIGGVDVARHPLEARKQVGVTLGDERSWSWRLSGRRNLQFYGVLYGLRGSEADTRVSELLSRLG